MRVVALLPAASEMVCALGGIDRLVGVSHECDYPPQVTRLPKLTRSAVNGSAPAAAIDAGVRALTATGSPLFTVEAARLAALEPDVILTQGVCDVCAVSEEDVRAIAARLASAPEVVTLDAHNVEGVFRDLRRVGAALNLDKEADAMLEALVARLGAVHSTLRHARAPRRRVAVIEWSEPLFVAGHWVPEMIHRAGGIDVAGTAGEHSSEIEPSDLRALEPELLLFAPCGFSLARAQEDGQDLLSRPNWQWARDKQVWAIDGNALTSRPGPRIVDGVETIAQILHPLLFAPPSRDLAIRLAGVA